MLFALCYGLHRTVLQFLRPFPPPWYSSTLSNVESFILILQLLLNIGCPYPISTGILSKGVFLFSNVFARIVDPDSLTVWIRNPDPAGSGFRGKQMKKNIV
jgi:hypothetical protein